MHVLRKCYNFFRQKVRPNEIQLKIELVPKPLWYKNLWKSLKESDNLKVWYDLKQEIIAKEGNQCWICGTNTEKILLGQFYIYDDLNHIQILGDVHLLCDLCHKVKHFGFWTLTTAGQIQLEQASLTEANLVSHFCTVNRVNIQFFQKYFDIAYALYEKRSQFINWSQNFETFLNKYNIKY